MLLLTLFVLLLLSPWTLALGDANTDRMRAIKDEEKNHRDSYQLRLRDFRAFCLNNYDNYKKVPALRTACFAESESKMLEKLRIYCDETEATELVSNFCDKYDRPREGAVLDPREPPPPSHLHEYGVYLIVYKGVFSDGKKYRHTCLWFVPRGYKVGWIIQANGERNFKFEIKLYRGPQTGNLEFSKLTPVIGVAAVTQLNAGITTTALETLMKSVPVERSADTGYCQTWVLSALLKLRSQELISDTELKASKEKLEELTTRFKTEDEDPSQEEPSHWRKLFRGASRGQYAIQYCE